MGKSNKRSLFFIGAIVVACGGIFILRGYHPIVSLITLKHMLEIGMALNSILWSSLSV
jgi:hypothetical protein